nr:hypothetical protein [Methanobrevibacter arboriphilus]
MLAKNILNGNLSDKQKWIYLDKKTRKYCDGMKEYRLKDKLSVASNLMDNLNVKGVLRKQVEYMIRNEFKNFKDLSKNCSNEQIIALIIFYVMKSNDFSLLLEKYKIFTQLNLTNKHYMTFATKLCKFYQNKVPVYVEISSYISE